MSDLHFKFWPKNLPHDITLPNSIAVVQHRSIGKTLSGIAQRWVYYDKIVTLRGISTASRTTGWFFYKKKCNVKRGDRVALYMQNCPQFVIAYYAILRADAMVVPINPMNLSRRNSNITQRTAAVKFSSLRRKCKPQIAPLLEPGAKKYKVTIMQSWRGIRITSRPQQILMCRKLWRAAR